MDESQRIDSALTTAFATIAGLVRTDYQAKAFRLIQSRAVAAAILAASERALPTDEDIRTFLLESEALLIASEEELLPLIREAVAALRA